MVPARFPGFLQNKRSLGRWPAMRCRVLRVDSGPWLARACKSEKEDVEDAGRDGRERGGQAGQAWQGRR